MPPLEGHELEDEPLEQEIVLLGELMAAAAGAIDHLDDARIDGLLDNTPAPSETARGNPCAGPAP